MLISATKSKHITNHFIEPYFIQTDSAGMIITACEKVISMLSDKGIRNYQYKNIFSIFSEISIEPGLFNHDLAKDDFPRIFDLQVSLKKTKCLNIQWIASPVTIRPRQKGWQLTGMETPPEKTRPGFYKDSHNGLAQKEKSLSDSIINSMPGIFYLFDQNGKFLRWNKRFETISGFSNEEISNMSPVDFFSTKEKNYISNGIEKVFTDGISDAEANLVTRNGTEIPHYFTGQLITFDRKPCLIGVGIDISELRKAEQLLALEKKVLKINSDQNASLAGTMDCFLLGIEKIFPDMRCAVLTLDEDGLSIRTLSAPGLPTAFSEHINGLPIGPEAGSFGAAMHLKKRIITTEIAKDPVWKSFKDLALAFDLRACCSLPVMNADGEIIAGFTIFYKLPGKPSKEELAVIDRTADLVKIIIEKKQAEEKIKLSNQRYTLATKATNDAIWDWDMKSGLYFWGEGFYTQFGFKPFSNTYNKTFWENHIHPADSERVIQSKENFIRKKDNGLWSEEYRFQKADGKYVIVSDRGFLVFDENKNLTRVIGSMQDITEKKNLERKILQQELSKQKLIGQAMINAQEKERAEIGQELHDNVNQILSTGKLYAELAKTNDEERLSLLESCSQNINHAINEIRKLTRALVPASIEDLGLLDSINDLVENIKATKKMNVEFYSIDWSDENIEKAQKLTLFRIIQEQVSNVIKHSGASNLIIELEMDEYENIIKLNIADDGKGFDPEKIKAKKSLGFSNIISRADLFDGKISIQSAPERGCRLNVRIPIHN